MKQAVLLLALLFSLPAFAEDPVMDLFPNQRANHQSVMDSAAQNYEERGQDFIENLYQNHGESVFRPEENVTAAASASITPAVTTPVAGPETIQGAIPNDSQPDLSVDTSHTPSDQTESGPADTGS